MSRAPHLNPVPLSQFSYILPFVSIVRSVLTTEFRTDHANTKITAGTNIQVLKRELALGGGAFQGLDVSVLHLTCLAPIFGGTTYFPEVDGTSPKPAVLPKCDLSPPLGEPLHMIPKPWSSSDLSNKFASVSRRPNAPGRRKEGKSE